MKKLKSQIRNIFIGLNILSLIFITTTYYGLLKQESLYSKYDLQKFMPKLNVNLLTFFNFLFQKWYIGIVALLILVVINLKIYNCLKKFISNKVEKSEDELKKIKKKMDLITIFISMFFIILFLLIVVNPIIEFDVKTQLLFERYLID